MSNALARLREMVVTDVSQHYPENADKADAIVDRLLELPQMHSDDNIIAFTNSYRRAVEKRDGIH